MIITIDKEEFNFCKSLAQGRFDRARQRGSSLDQIGKKFSRYQDDIHGMLSEWAFCKLTNTFPSQVISPVLKTKRSGEDLGDVKYKNLNFDVKSTHHPRGELWTDIINDNIDAYVFIVVHIKDTTAECHIKGVMMSDELHSKGMTHGSKNQFRKPAYCATIEELTDWESFDKATA